MRKIIEILRLKHEAKLSHQKIARALGISKGAVSKYLSLAQAKGIGWPLPPAMDEAALEQVLFARASAPARFVEPDLPRIHQELKRKGVTLQLLWAEYVATHGEAAYRYSQFCHRYRRWRDGQRRSMRQLHRAGEKLFIDYCGPTVAVVDPATGEVRQAQVFVAVLGASSYTYAEATWTQGLPDWIGAHQRALRFFGGAPELLVPDYVPGNIMNRLFCWTELGAKHLGIIQSLLTTCRLQGVDPYAYLVDVLQRVGLHPASRVEELTPRLWKEKFQAHALESDLDGLGQ